LTFLAVCPPISQRVHYNYNSQQRLESVDCIDKFDMNQAAWLY